MVLTQITNEEVTLDLNGSVLTIFTLAVIGDILEKNGRIRIVGACPRPAFGSWDEILDNL
jgi:hypothetical protein